MRRERQQCICIPANLPCILILDILVALTATMAKYNDRNNTKCWITGRAPFGYQYGWKCDRHAFDKLSIDPFGSKHIHDDHGGRTGNRPGGSLFPRF